MKNNRLTARVLALFAAVLLVTALSVPAFAATSYTFSPEPGFSYYFSKTSLPEGTYQLIGFTEIEGIPLTFRSSSPVSITYGPYFDSADHYEDACFLDVTLSFFDPINEIDESASCNFLFVRDFMEAEGFRFFALTSDGSLNFSELGMTFTFTPVYSSPSLIDYITADTLPNVFNEIISLLPIALGVLVGYIAIRKGISYLQSFLHNS